MKWLACFVVYSIVAISVVIITAPFYLLKVLCDLMVCMNDKCFDWLDNMIQDKIK